MYFWIVTNNNRRPQVIFDSIGTARLFKDYIGPYFSYKEVVTVLYKWIDFERSQYKK